MLRVRRTWKGVLFYVRFRIKLIPMLKSRFCDTETFLYSVYNVHPCIAIGTTLTWFVQQLRDFFLNVETYILVNMKCLSVYTVQTSCIHVRIRYTFNPLSPFHSNDGKFSIYLLVLIFSYSSQKRHTKANPKRSKP